MKSDLWFVFAVTAGFLGFLMGYGVPPMAEVGLDAIGGHRSPQAEQSKEREGATQQLEDLQKLME